MAKDMELSTSGLRTSSLSSKGLLEATSSKAMASLGCDDDIEAKDAPK